jgi:hypothetical protein
MEFEPSVHNCPISADKFSDPVRKILCSRGTASIRVSRPSPALKAASNMLGTFFQTNMTGPVGRFSLDVVEGSVTHYLQ